MEPFGLATRGKNRLNFVEFAHFRVANDTDMVFFVCRLGATLNVPMTKRFVFRRKLIEALVFQATIQMERGIASGNATTD